MILSMTGYGSAQEAHDGVDYAVEIRSFNHRYFKSSIKLPEHLQFAEHEVDGLIRKHISRGSVTYSLRIRAAAGGGPEINQPALQKFVDRLSEIKGPKGTPVMIDLAGIVQLPGIGEPSDLDESARARELERIQAVTKESLKALSSMRREEGRALAADLNAGVECIQEELSVVAGRAPLVLEEYHQRLRNRVAALLQKAELDLESDALMREVAVYAERSDIGEEIARIRSHLEQFLELCRRGGPVGRTLDFLAQELLREANTIGSKSNDAAIARSVVLIKGHIDRLKEQLQNVE